MRMQRFGSPECTLLLPPRPGERETRFRQTRDRTMNHPREGKRDV